MRDDRVIVVGAGPVGTVLALALRRRGIPVVLLEALEGPERDCRAASCHPPTVKMLDELGLLNDGLAQGLVSPAFHYLDRLTGDLVGRFDIRDMADPPEHPYVLQWEQYKIAETILARLASDSGADIRMGARVTGVAQDGNGITATVRGPDGVQPIRGRFLVGCDGGRSTVRKLAGIAFDGFTWPERFIKIDTRHDFTALGPKIDNRNYFSDPDEWMNLFKARGEDGSGMWRAVSPTLPDQSDEEILSADAIEARLQRFCPSPTRYELATVALYRVHQRVAHTFNKGRILLAGDAAHVNNPVGGMGMNGGIHDAINLAGAMHKVWFEGGDPDALFDRYTRQRRKGQVDGVQLQSIRNKEMLAEKDPKRRAQRLAAIRRAAEKPDEHDAFIRRACMIDSLRQANAIA